MLDTIRNSLRAAIGAATNNAITSLPIGIPPTGKGDIAIAIGAALKQLRCSPRAVWESIGYAVNGLPVRDVVVEGPFVNLTLETGALFTSALRAIAEPNIRVGSPERIMVEYLSPNTNKPLHLGHVRNGVLGSTVANLLSGLGHVVVRAELINDRGEHICKSMLAYERHGRNKTPDDVAMKGDHFVGDMYVRYADDDRKRRGRLKRRAIATLRRLYVYESDLMRLTDEWENDGKGDLKQLLKLVPADTDLHETLRLCDGKDLAVTALLQQWENGDEHVCALWAQMNEWVYAGFADTTARYGFGFDTVYHESKLYMLGKDEVTRGLESGVFFTDEYGAVRFSMPIDIFGANRDGKPRQPKLLNADGTSLYMTQDIGTAILKATDFSLDRSIYVVADEQDHHFQALFAILRALGYPWASHCYHLSYAMVELPSGKMKSREGTVVEADDLADQMMDLALALVQTRDPDLPEAEAKRRAETIGMAAIKFYLLRYAATTTVSFNPEETLSFEGDTGPYCLYAFARARSVIRKAAEIGIKPLHEHSDAGSRLSGDTERACMLELLFFPDGIRKAAENYAPAILVDRMLRLAKAFNKFYRESQIITKDLQLTEERLALVESIANALKWGLSFIGIAPLEHM